MRTTTRKVRRSAAVVAFESLPPATRARLLKQIARLRERAYREGFEDGFKARGQKIPITEEELADWRRLSEGVSAPPPHVDGDVETAVERLRMVLTNKEDIVKILMALVCDSLEQ